MKFISDIIGLFSNSKDEYNKIVKLIINKELNPQESYIIKKHLKQIKKLTDDGILIEEALNIILTEEEKELMIDVLSPNNIKASNIYDKSLDEIKPEKYKFIKKLGDQLKGSVFLAIDNLNNKFIVKEFKKKNNACTEYNNLKIIKDKCIDYYVCVYEYYETNSCFYIVMEYLENYKSLSEYKNIIRESLNKLIKGETNENIIKSKNILNEMFLALRFLNSINITHNNITIENIMCDFENSKIKFINFELSYDGKNKNDLIINDENYLDPLLYNKFKNKIPITLEDRKTSDIWCLGVIYYFLIIDRMPIRVYSKFRLKNDLFKKSNYNNDFFKLYNYSDDKNSNYINERMNFIGIDMNSLLNIDIKQRNLNY